MQSIFSKCAGALFRRGNPTGIPTAFLFVESNCGASTAVTGHGSFRMYSGKLGASPATVDPEKSVFISQSADIHTNLALEDWLYRNSNFENHQVLLLWRNDPCVVIGRHQNPWAEMDVPLAEESNLKVARRNSGGGCVYHDRGNLNCTFFTPRAAYNRKQNLQIICRALDRQFGIQAEISSREDVTVDGCKISGTAAKLGKNAYHHCTVLVDADVKKLSALLNPNTEGLESKATQSVKAPVKNIKTKNSSASVENVLATIGYEFLRTDSNGNDGGDELIQKQRGFQMINPTNEWFPGLEKIRSDFRSWEWNFGKTPAFAFHKTFPVGRDGDTSTKVTFRVQVVKGLIDQATVEFPTDKPGLLDSTTFADLSAFISALKDRPFHTGILATFEGLLFKKHTPVSFHETQQRMREALF